MKITCSCGAGFEVSDRQFEYNSDRVQAMIADFLACHSACRNRLKLTPEDLFPRHPEPQTPWKSVFEAPTTTRGDAQAPGNSYP